MEWINNDGQTTMNDLDILGLSFQASQEAAENTHSVPRSERAGECKEPAPNVLAKKEEERLYDGDYHGHDDENYLSLSQSAATSLYATSPLVTLEGTEEKEEGGEFLEFMEGPVETLRIPESLEAETVEIKNGIVRPETKQEEKQKEKQQQSPQQEEEEMVVVVEEELPHPDALEKLYTGLTRKDEEWQKLLAEKPVIVIEESATPYTASDHEEMDDFDLEKVKVYIKKNGMTRGRNQPLSVLRGATQHLVKLYRRQYMQNMKILVTLKEEIEKQRKLY